MRIDAWEWRWPLNTNRNRDASKLSRALLDRLAEAEAMSLDDYRRDIAQRDKNRALYAELAGECEACISLSAPSAAPMGLESTGDPRCTRPTSVFPRSRCRCSATKGFRWACRSRASSTATPMRSPAPPRSRGCSETQTPASSADAFGASLPSVDLVFAEAGLYGSPTLPNSIGNRDLETVHDRKCVLLLLPDTAVTVGRCRRHHQANGGPEDPGSGAVFVRGGQS